jgi:hypothetical protein
MNSLVVHSEGYAQLQVFVSTTLDHSGKEVQCERTQLFAALQNTSDNQSVRKLPDRGNEQAQENFRCESVKNQICPMRNQEKQCWCTRQFHGKF